MIRRRIRLGLLALIALLPPILKPWIYRQLLGYHVGDGVHIGISIIDADSCEIGNDVNIGHGNVVLNVSRLSIGHHATIGHLNIIRGGDTVTIGEYCSILRLNEINSIPDPVVVNPTSPQLLLGAGAVVTTGHKLDFTDSLKIGPRAIIGGRNSSIWTHNRQQTAPVSIGEKTYVGSDCRFAPGSSVPASCIVGMGAVVVDQLDIPASLIAGVPARVVKPLDDNDLSLVERNTRDDLPEAL